MKNKSVKTGCALALLVLVSGCAPQVAGYDGGAPFAPYSSGYGTPGVNAENYSSGYSGYGRGYAQQRRPGPGAFSKRNMGALGGAALGGWGGSQIGNGTGQLAATAAGVLLGALAGGVTGDSLDKADEAYAYMQLQRSLDANRPVAWQGQSSAGVVTPLRTVPKQKKADPTCREFRHEVLVGDEKKEGIGRACLQRDGSWKLANG
jgi:surface antigen